MNAKELGIKIRARRKELGYTILDLARLTGLTHPTIGAIENATNNYRNDSLVRILKVIDLDLSEKSVDKVIEPIQHVDDAVQTALSALSRIRGVTQVAISINGTANGNTYTKTFSK